MVVTRNKTATCRLVGYRRTSTDDQKLGILAQDETLARIARERGCDLVRVFTEHESGGNCERIELDRAIKYARRVGAVLVVAKLDRLARDSNFLMRLYDGNVGIIFGDLPEIDGSAASRFMLQSMSNVAEFERRRIGERTKEALAQLKAKGVKLGAARPECRNLTQAAREKGASKAAQNRTARAVEEMTDVATIAIAMRKEGASLREIAAELDRQGILTRQGGDWNAVQVSRVLDRADRLDRD
jgi:DNA invertase Pin-like site-specific DNA recombinase